MRPASEEVQNAAVIAIFKPFILSCLVVLVVLQACLWAWPQLYDLLPEWRHGRARGLFFFAIAYTTVLPYFGFRLIRKLPLGWKPGVSIFHKVVATIFAWVFFPVLIVAPALILLHPEPSGRAASFQAVLSTLLGLALMGPLWSFAACLILWALIASFLPRPRSWSDPG